MRYILGVDGGGSKTYSVVVDEHGNRVGTGISGCGNHQLLGLDTALDNISQASGTALSEAGLQPEQIDFVLYGLAGADREKDFAILRPALATLPFRHWDVVCDTMEGLRIGSRHNVGVVLVCGSNTNAAGRNSRGDMVQTGGFGYMFGDAAGGQHMAVETFRAAVRSWEMRDIPSLLQKRVAGFFGFNTMAQVFNNFLDRDVDRVPGELTIVLHEAAREGDELAIRILTQAGTELGLAANSVIRRLGGFKGMDIPIVIVGSVVQKGRSPQLLRALEATLAKDNHTFHLMIPKMAPVYGAILMGMDRMGIAVTDKIYDRFVSYGG